MRTTRSCQFEDDEPPGGRRLTRELALLLAAAWSVGGRPLSCVRSRHGGLVRRLLYCSFSYLSPAADAARSASVGSRSPGVSRGLLGPRSRLSAQFFSMLSSCLTSQMVQAG